MGKEFTKCSKKVFWTNQLSAYCVNVYLCIHIRRVAADHRDNATHGERGGVSGEAGILLWDDWWCSGWTDVTDDEGEQSTTQDAAEDEQRDKRCGFTVCVAHRQFTRNIRHFTFWLVFKYRRWFVNLFTFDLASLCIYTDTVIHRVPHVVGGWLAGCMDVLRLVDE